MPVATLSHAQVVANYVTKGGVPAWWVSLVYTPTKLATHLRTLALTSVPPPPISWSAYALEPRC